MRGENLLQIYNISTERRVVKHRQSKYNRVDGNVYGSGENADEEIIGNSEEANMSQEDRDILLLEYEIRLQGAVTGILALPGSLSSCDSLLISFEEAKMSMVKWNSDELKFDTISLHYYERPTSFQYGKNGNVSYNNNDAGTRPPHLIRDPSSTCAALRFGKENLAVLPLRSAGLASDKDLDLDLDLNYAENIEKPFYASFVLSLFKVGDIRNIITEMFLHEYREPTLGVLYSPHPTTTTGLLPKIKDSVSFTAITIDLQSREMTPIVSIKKLPYDIYGLVAMPVPIGGSILIGTNEVIHVDQAGRAFGLALNPYASKSSDFFFKRTHEKNIELVNAHAFALHDERGTVLIFNGDGQAYKVTVSLEGRSISNLNLEPIGIEADERILLSTISCSTVFPGERLFLGSLEGDSLFINWAKKAESGTFRAQYQVTEVETKTQGDDDLYGDEESQERKASIGNHIFSVHDILVNIAPIKDFKLAKLSTEKLTPADTQIVAATGSYNSGNVTLLRKTFSPMVIGQFHFPNAQDVFSVEILRLNRSFKQRKFEMPNFGAELVTYIFLTTMDSTTVLLAGKVFEEVQGTSFNSRARSLLIDCFSDKNLLVQVTWDRIVLYNGSLERHDSLALRNLKVEKDVIIKRAVSLDPFIVAIMSDGSPRLIRVDYKERSLGLVASNDDFNELLISSIELSSAEDLGDVWKRFHEIKVETNWELDGSLPSGHKKHPLLGAIVTHSGDFQVWSFGISGIERLFSLRSEVVREFTDIVTLPNEDKVSALNNTRVDEEEEEEGDDDDEGVVEASLMSFNVSKGQTYLLLRCKNEKIVAYRIRVIDKKVVLVKERVLAFGVPKPAEDFKGNDEENRKKESVIFEPSKLQRIHDFDGHRLVFVKGQESAIITRDRRGLINYCKAFPLKSVTEFVAEYRNSLMYIDFFGSVKILNWESGESIFNGWSIRRIPFDSSVDYVGYHSTKNQYVVASHTHETFNGEQEEEEKDKEEKDKEEKEKEEKEEEQGEGESKKESKQVKPKLLRGTVNLLSPVNWTVIDKVELGPQEQILCIQSVWLEVGIVESRRKEYIFVGTGIIKGEDHITKGTFYMFDIVDVNAQSDRRETNRKLRILTKEEVNGPVSAIAEIKGYPMVAQGSKIMVRSMGDHGTLIPVAFYDMPNYVTSAKVLRNLVVFSDYFKSLHFVGFEIEPYKMTMFGRDPRDMPVEACDFLLDDDQIAFAAGDSDKNLVIFRYDPENVKSLGGIRLIRKAEMHIGHRLTQMIKLPMVSTMDPRGDGSNYLCLGSSRDGSFVQVFAVEEQFYRMMNILQAQIINAKPQPAGLNPRAYWYVKKKIQYCYYYIIIIIVVIIIVVVKYCCCKILMANKCRASTTNADTTNPAKGILNGSFIRKYFNFPTSMQNDLARKSGTKRELLNSGLQMMESYISYL